MLRTLLVLLSASFLWVYNTEQEPRVLIFSKTKGFDGYRHASIEDGKKMFRALAKEHHFEVRFTEDVQYFTDDSLREFDAIVFLSATGDLFNSTQQVALQRFIQGGGGFMGIHGASGTEYGWPWYGKLVGAWFESHPKDQSQKATISIADTAHPATKALPNPWEHTEEWYNFHSLSSEIQVLGFVDEDDYSGGTHGEDHPVFWYQEFDGGRSFYTALGHHPEAYYDSTFIFHIWSGLEYVLADNQTPDYSQEIKPNEVQLRKDHLVGQPLIGEPMELSIADNGDVYVASRRGELMKYSPDNNQARRIGMIPVNHDRYDGLVGMTLDPDFSDNRWLYVYYPTLERQKYQYHLSRFTLDEEGMLDVTSEKILLNVPLEKIQDNHSGGSLTFDAEGNLYLSTGDNTNPFESDGFAPTDERAGRKIFDAQRSSGNTNDLRGKILRIHPEDDGSYSIPDGNLFPLGSEQARSEIYIMGLRNPYRISIDQETSWLYWGDVGPDARHDSVQGPKGYDEINRAKTAGNYGWPYFMADNRAYADVDFATGEIGDRFDPKAPVNDSPRNTGLKVLPPAQGAFIWYPYDKSEEFPAVGAGGRTALAGPVYHYDANNKSDYNLPSYYDGDLFIYDWVRDWIMVVRMDSEGNYNWMEPFMPSTTFHHIMDMEVGPEGALYLLEYGSEWRKPNQEAALSRIRFDRSADIARIISEKPAEVDAGSGQQPVPEGKKLLSESDCNACHVLDAESAGPSFLQIARKYPQRPEVVDRLAATIIEGGSGNWGQRVMTPHPDITKEEATTIVKYILSLSESGDQ